MIGTLVLLWLGTRLGISRTGSEGFLIAGSNLVARIIGAALKDAGQDVLLVDTSRENVNAAKMAGLPTFRGNILSDRLLRQVEGTGIGRLLALTPSPDVNSLATIHFSRHFGRSQVFQLAISPEDARIDARVKADISLEMRGRVLFKADLTFEAMTSLLSAGHEIRKTLLTREFDFTALESRNDGRAIPLFLIDPGGELLVSTADDPVAPKAGQSVIALLIRAAADIKDIAHAGL